MKLSELKPGQSASVVSVNSADLSVKILEMGILPGKKILVRHRSFFGDPLAIEIQGSVIALRKSEAELIEVHLS